MLSKRRSASASVLLLAIAVLVAACGSSGSTSNGGSGGAGKSSKSVTVGLVSNLSGDAANAFGVPFHNAFEMALKDIDANGLLRNAGVSIKLVTEDANSEVPKAVTAFNKLVQDGAPIVLHDSQSPQGLAIAPIANQDKVTFLSGAGSKLENPAGYAFRFTDLASPTGAVGTFLAKDGRKRVAAIVAVDNPSFATLAQLTEKGLKDAAGTGFVDTEKVSSSDSDFSSVLTNVEKQNPDAVLLSVLPQQAGNIIRQMAQSSSLKDVRVVGTLAFSTQVFQVAGNAAVGAVFPQVWAPGQKQSAKFEKAYDAKYGESPTAYAALGYEMAWVTAAAIANVASSGADINGTTLRDAIPAASTAQVVKDNGVVPGFSISKEGAASSPGVLATFNKDGKIVVANP